MILFLIFCTSLSKGGGVYVDGESEYPMLPTRRFKSS